MLYFICECTLSAHSPSTQTNLCRSTQYANCWKVNIWTFPSLYFQACTNLKIDDCLQTVLTKFHQLKFDHRPAVYCICNPSVRCRLAAKIFVLFGFQNLLEQSDRGQVSSTQCTFQQLDSSGRSLIHNSYFPSIKSATNHKSIWENLMFHYHPKQYWVCLMHLPLPSIFFLL